MSWLKNEIRAQQRSPISFRPISMNPKCKQLKLEEEEEDDPVSEPSEHESAIDL